MLENNDISIVISGCHDSGKALAALLINKALMDSGFLDVKMVSETGKSIAPISMVPSILDIVKQGAPDLFQTRVIIQEVKTCSPSRKSHRPREPEAPVDSEG